uniref:DUS-like FMN-binding domain-containing protein n=2 Tax=Schistocephalus solidus TaxID=70667 RepID=A0A0X3P290_SCHSO
MKDGYGAAMLKQPELIADLVKAGRSVVPRWRCPADAADHNKHPTADQPISLPFSLSIKVRLVPTSSSRATGADSSEENNVKLTVELIRRAAAMGLDWVTIHGRTPSQRTSNPCQWEAIHDIIAARIPHLEHGCAPMPIFLNGDVTSIEDAWRAHQLTDCRGVMVARGLLANPALFDPNVAGNGESEHKFRGTCSLLREWLELTTEHSNSTLFKNIHRQAYWMLERHLNKARRKVLHEISDVAGLYNFLHLQCPNTYPSETVQT